MAAGFFGWSKHVAKWEADAAGEASKIMSLVQEIETLRWHLPDPEAAQTIVQELGLLYTTSYVAQFHMDKAPAGADRSVLAHALEESEKTGAKMREVMKLPGNVFAAEKRN